MLESLRDAFMYVKVAKVGMAKQALATLVGSQSTTLLKEIVTTWRQMLQEFKRQRHIESLQDEVLRQRVAKEGMARQALATLLGSQATTLLKEVVTTWQQLLQELKMLQ